MSFHLYEKKNLTLPAGKVHMCILVKILCQTKLGESNDQQGHLMNKKINLTVCGTKATPNVCILSNLL